MYAHTRAGTQAHKRQTDRHRHIHTHTRARARVHACTRTHTMTELLGGGEGGRAEVRKRELLLIKIPCEKMSFQTRFEGG